MQLNALNSRNGRKLIVVSLYFLVTAILFQNCTGGLQGSDTVASQSTPSGANPTPTPTPTPSPSVANVNVSSSTVTIAPASVAIGQTTTISSNITANQNLNSAEATFFFTYTSGGTPVYTDSIYNAPLNLVANVGQTVTWSYTVPSDIPAGTYTVQLLVRSSDWVTTYLSNPNVGSLTVTANSASGSGSSGSSSSGYLPGAFIQTGFRGISINQLSTWASGQSALLQLQGTDSQTGFTLPPPQSIWVGGTIGAEASSIYDDTDNNINDFVNSIQGPITLPAGTLPGSGSTEMYFNVRHQAAYNGNVAAPGGGTTQDNFQMFPNGGNFGKGYMYYIRKWVYLSPNFQLTPGSNGGQFIMISEHKAGGGGGVGTTPYSRVTFTITTIAGGMMFALSSDSFLPSGYALNWADYFDPTYYPIPLGQWFLVEFAARPSDGADGFGWAAINGHVLNSHIAQQAVNYTYPASGAHTGPNEQTAASGDVAGFFLQGFYSNVSCSASNPVDIGAARFELWDHFPPDASTPHP